MRHFEGFDDKKCEPTGEYVLIINNKEAQIITEAMRFAHEARPRVASLKAMKKATDQIQCWSGRKSDFKIRPMKKDLKQ